MAETFYTIEEDTKYTTTFTRTDNVEDVGEEFLTWEEFNEMYGNSYNNYWYEDGQYTYIKVAKVTNVLNDVKQQLIADKKKSMVVNDEELIHALVKYSRAVSNFVPNMRRVGNRFSYDETVKKEKVGPKKTDVTALVNIAARIASKASGIEITFKYVQCNCRYAVETVKKLVSWEDLVRYFPENKIEQKIVDNYKQIWDNPAMFETAA